jgi:hypothetical protein
MAGWYQRRPDRVGVFLQTTPRGEDGGRGANKPSDGADLGVTWETDGEQ